MYKHLNYQHSSKIKQWIERNWILKTILSSEFYSYAKQTNQILLKKRSMEISILPETIFHEGHSSSDPSLSVLPNQTNGIYVCLVRVSMCSIVTSVWTMPRVRTCEQSWREGGGGRGEAVLAVEGTGEDVRWPGRQSGCRVPTFVMLLRAATVTVTVKPVWKLRTLPWRLVGRGTAALKVVT